MGRGWNHNLQYHDDVLRTVPQRCERALDVGCGRGELARKMAERCGEVIAIDSDARCISAARVDGVKASNITFLCADAMTHGFELASFDLIAIVSALHHLPMRESLLRFDALMKPGGRLVVVGPCRLETLSDYALAAMAKPVSWAIRFVRGEAKVEALLQNPQESLRELRAAFYAVLPRGTLQRRFFFRYVFVWHKPLAAARTTSAL